MIIDCIMGLVEVGGMVVLIFIFRTVVILGFVARIRTVSWRLNFMGSFIRIVGHLSVFFMGLSWWSRSLLLCLFINDWFICLFIHYFVQDCSLSTSIVAIIPFEFPTNYL